MSKTNYAYDVLKKQILSGKYSPGEEISEKIIQEELNISRTPIREALQTLQKEGFIEILPRKSIRVAPVTFHLMEEIYDTRLTLEPELFRRACGKIPDKILLYIRDKMMNPPQNFVGVDQAFYFNYLDNEFHTSILPYANNHFLSDALAITFDHEIQFRNILFNASMNDICTKEHVAIINALLQRSETDVVKWATIHVENARKKAFLHFFDHNV